MPKPTSLHAAHIDMGAKMVDFGGWDMPLHYGSQLQEHHQVRRDAGMFDVSHMTVVDLRGERVRDFLRYLLANSIDKITSIQGKALYSCMLNEQGGVIDDLIIYNQGQGWVRMVVNAATRDKDLAWINKQAEAFAVEVTERDDLSMIAVQGPNARGKALTLIDEQYREAAAALKPFNALEAGDWFVARTGYTGEDGFEIMVPDAQADAFWRELAKAGVEPCGLGARDTLRLEAGMALYGSDMDESVTPWEAGLSWTVSLDEGRDFIGRNALETSKAEGVAMRQVGLLLEGRGVLRGHQKVICEAGEGETTSGGFSPTLESSIALARVPAAIGEHCEVEIRGKRVAAKVVKPPFARNGKSCLN